MINIVYKVNLISETNRGNYYSAAQTALRNVTYQSIASVLSKSAHTNITKDSQEYSIQILAEPDGDDKGDYLTCDPCLSSLQSLTPFPPTFRILIPRLLPRSSDHTKFPFDWPLFIPLQHNHFYNRTVGICRLRNCLAGSQTLERETRYYVCKKPNR